MRSMTTRLKVCCIMSVEEARIAIAAGASAIGLVAEMPSGPGTISDEAIAEIARCVPPGISRFLLTCRTEAEAIIDHVKRCQTDVVQLVDHVEASVYARLRVALPHVRIVQVIHVQGPQSLEEVRSASPQVDAILLDSGCPALPVKVLGGTGRVHDWNISAQAVALAAPTPVYLAGGLSPHNVGEAIARVRPFGIDLCSGVRQNGGLDTDRLAALVQAMRAADARIACSPPVFEGVMR